MNRRWVSVHECSEYLGIHPKSVYRLIDKAEIPASRIGGSVRVDLRELERVLEEREQINKRGR